MAEELEYPQEGGSYLRLDDGGLEKIAVGETVEQVKARVESRTGKVTQDKGKNS